MSPIKPEHWLSLRRDVRFGEIDSAGVIHFYQLLRWCHEAWEESLQRYGLQASDVFPVANNEGKPLQVALPIVHCEADFRAPIRTGHSLEVKLSPERIDMGSFQVQTKFQREGDFVAMGLIRHVAIDVQTRQRSSLPEGINLWLEASALHLGIRPI